MKSSTTSSNQSFDIVARTAHELRSPLVAIAGYLSLIDESGTHLDVAQKKYLYRAIESTRKSLLLIDCLLDIESVSRRSPSPKLAPLRLDSILKIIAKEYNQKFNQAGLTVKQERSYRLPLVMAARVQMISIFRHVYNYMLDYTKRGNIIVHFRNRDGKLVIKLTIDSTLPATAEAGSTIKLSARDIELYIAQYMLRLSGGDLTVREFPKTCSTIYISIPLAHQLKLSV